MSDSDVNKIFCRICLCNIGPFEDIFKSIKLKDSQDKIHISEMICSFTNVRITVGDGLPEQICTLCSQEAEKMYIFKQKCEQADKYLRKKLLPSKNSQNNPSKKLYIKLEDYQTVSYNQQQQNMNESMGNHIFSDSNNYIDLTESSSISPIFKNDIKMEEFEEITENDNEIDKINIDVDEEPNFDFKNDTDLMNDSDNFSEITTELNCNDTDELNNKTYTCEFCQQDFEDPSKLKEHIGIHKGKKPLPCIICGKGFSQLYNLRQHQVRHSGLRLHLCKTCGNGFTNKIELQVHQNEHIGVKPFVCDTCGNEFTTSCSLKKHTGEKPHGCNYCEMEFSCLGTLSSHKCIHTGEKLFVCPFCKKTFTISNDFKSHLRIHAGKKPYICADCGRAYKQIRALRKHRKRHLKRKRVRPKNAQD